MIVAAYSKTVRLCGMAIARVRGMLSRCTSACSAWIACSGCGVSASANSNSNSRSGYEAIPQDAEFEFSEMRPTLYEHEGHTVAAAEDPLMASSEEVDLDSAERLLAPLLDSEVRLLCDREVESSPQVVDWP